MAGQGSGDDVTARQDVVDALQALTVEGGRLEGVHVIEYARRIDAPAVPTVLVRQDSVEPSTFPQAWLDYVFGLVLVPPTIDPEQADADLEALLTDVLFALEQADNMTWSKATRGTFQDTQFPAYEVTVSVPFAKE